MDVLRSFHSLNLQARVLLTEFYCSLERLTDGQGLLEISVSQEFRSWITHHGDHQAGLTCSVHGYGTGMASYQNGKTSWERV